MAIKDTVIGEKVFVTQTTYYIYRNEEDRKKDIIWCVTSDKRVFNRHKNRERRKLKK